MAKMEIETPLPAMDPGMHLLAVRLESDVDEFTTLNNSRRILFDVKRSKRRVFLYSNAPDWDLTFLKRNVESFPDYEASTVIEPGNGNQVSLEGAGQFRFPGKAGDDQGRAIETSNVVVLHGDMARLPRSVREKVSARRRTGDIVSLLMPSALWSDACSRGAIDAL